MFDPRKKLWKKNIVFAGIEIIVLSDESRNIYGIIHSNLELLTPSPLNISDAFSEKIRFVIIDITYSTWEIIDTLLNAYVSRLNNTQLLLTSPFGPKATRAASFYLENLGYLAASPSSLPISPAYFLKAAASGRKHQPRPSKSWAASSAPQHYSDRSLNELIKHHKLRFLYQPKVRLSDGHLCGLEQLLGYTETANRDTSLDSILAEIRSSNLIPELAVAGLKAAIQEGIFSKNLENKLPLSINWPRSTLLLPAHVAAVERILSYAKLSPQLVCLELSEHDAYTECRESFRALMALYLMGINISLDDFGVEQSNFFALSVLPVSEVKIDRCLTQQIALWPKARSIVKSIIELSHELDISVTAEGVESTDQLDVLKTLECDQIQGFIVARKMTPQELEQRSLTGPWLEVDDTGVNQQKYQA